MMKPSLKKFDRLIKKTRAQARKAKFRKADVKEAIAEARKHKLSTCHASEGWHPEKLINLHCECSEAIQILSVIPRKSFCHPAIHSWYLSFYS